MFLSFSNHCGFLINVSFPQWVHHDLFQIVFNALDAHDRARVSRQDQVIMVL